MTAASVVRRWAGAVGVASLVAAGVAGAVGKAGDPSFAAAPVVSGGPHTCAAVTADFNADTHADLAVVDCKAKTARALLGDGGGAFHSTVGERIPIGAEARAVAVDLNRDAKPDLAVLGRSTLSILVGDGSGRFDSAPGSPLSTPKYGAAISAADVNVDGSIDLVVGTSKELVGRILTLLGDGSGGFRRAPHSVLLRSYWPSPLITTDINGDARPDLAVGTSDDFKTTIMLGDGAGGFRATRTLRIGLRSVGDFDRDGKVDLAAVSEARGVGVLRGAAGAASGRSPGLQSAVAPPGMPSPTTSTSTGGSTLRSAARVG
jgi:FG-GAP-like repeat